MPFDPAQPADHSPLSSAVMRDQLTSLKALIDAILTLTAAQVDGTTTLNPGDPATAAVSVDGNTLRFTFGIPRGQDGQAGQNGQDGGPGPTGPQGPPFATAVVDGVTTLNPGDNATVSVTFDGTNVHFTFGIPQGAQGIQGYQGPPGEVTTSQLDTAIATTAQNPTSVSPLSISFSDPPTSGELVQVQDKLNELLSALQRGP